jgi:predicted esterase
MRYYLALPDNYQNGDGRRWPVLVCLPGADADGAGLLERFRRARRDLPFVLVAPCTFANVNRLGGELLSRYRALYSGEVIRDAGGEGWLPDVRRRLDWDEAGLLAVLSDLEATCGAERRIYLTGFSGGGHLVYRMVVRHPDRLAGAVAVCANFNFWDHGYRTGPPHPEDRAVPVHLVLGENDPLRHARYGGPFFPTSPAAVLGVAGVTVGILGLIWKKTRSRRGGVLAALLGVAVVAVLVVGRLSGNETQTDLAARMLADLGYTEIRRTTLPHLAHDPAPDHVLKTVLEIRAVQAVE